ncbi:acetyl-CoA synthetase-like protein [Fistulina hepatica ATCC 64428]|uniref:Acetyl-CoA synthetase-like protein n=1 Tax=Fistulina hepatica ATCC 64428 TaxID=1128425 RepID=A0A0D7A4L8_9AGAR|nr:acetyl-CoA synthetase-like protein [Fistulina hepatica ATCC 64428]
MTIASRIPNHDALKASFEPPPLDGSLCVPEIYDWHATHNPDYPLFVYNSNFSPDSLVQKGGSLTIHTYASVAAAAHKAGRYVACLTGVPLDGDTKPIVAVLASSDSITFFTTLLGMMRAEIVPFLISPRNSAVAAAHLLKVQDVHHLLLSSDPHIMQLGQDAVAELHTQGHDVKIFSMPLFEDIYNGNPFQPLPPMNVEASTPIFMVHSSGSTAFPKPTIWTAQQQVQAARAPRNSFNWRGVVLAGHSIVWFHIAGINVCLFLPAVGIICAIFQPTVPAIVPSPEVSFKGIVDSAATTVFAMPSHVEAWAEDPAKLGHLRRMSGGIMFTSAPIQKAIGDHLCHVGVKIYNVYGMSETGVLSGYPPDFSGLDWIYSTLNPVALDYFRYRPLGDGTYELLIVRDPEYDVSITNTVYEGREAFATKDILEPHPTKPGLWRIVGRLDDQLVLSTGEKTNPTPLEGILRAHPLVKDSVMFGHGRFQNGIIVAPKDEYRFDPRDEKKLQEFREVIWPQIEKMNAYAPSHSRLAKEMIIVEDPARPFEFNSKGFPRRAPVLKLYDSDIEALYATVQAGSQSKVNYPDKWTEETVYRFVADVVHGTMRMKVTDDQDFFQYGCDSLQATWVRNELVNALRETKILPPGVELPSNIIYDHPTLTSLVACINKITALKSSDAIKVFDEHDLLDFATQYTQVFPKEVILLTGTTGSLGTALLAHLVNKESVGKIYAFNRRSRDRKSHDRQRESLRIRGYDENIADSSKVLFVDGSLTKEGIGMDNQDLEDEIRSSVTHIMHIAWRVDWKLSLGTFQDCVDGVLGLVRFALSSPRQTLPRFIFASSIAVLRNHDAASPAIEVPIVDPKVPLGQGYAESKWAAESILYAARERTCLRPTIVRIGQISGGVNGAWNHSDWVPAIVKSSVTLGCFPIVDGVCSWLGVEDMAKALIDAKDSEAATLHLVHPRPMHWSVLADVCSKELGLTLVPYSEWVARLKAQFEHEVAGQRKALLLPAGMLLNFLEAAQFKTQGGRIDEEAFGFAKISVAKMLEVSPTLCEARQLTCDDVRRWIEFWKSVGFL